MYIFCLHYLNFPHFWRATLSREKAREIQKNEKYQISILFFALTLVYDPISVTFVWINFGRYEWWFWCHCRRNEKKLPVKSVGGEGAAISTYDVVPGCTTYELGIKYPPTPPGFFAAVINIFLSRKYVKALFIVFQLIDKIPHNVAFALVFLQIDKIPHDVAFG